MNEFQQRRQKLSEMLPPNSAVVIAGAQEILRNGDAHYRFRQSSSFYYLTGFNEPDGVLILTSAPKSLSYLFNRSRNPAEEQWTGARLGQDGAKEILGMTDAFPIDSLKQYLPDMLADCDAVLCAMTEKSEINTLIFETLADLKAQARKGIKGPTMVIDVEPLISELRLFKSTHEISLMQKAADISVAAHLRALKNCRQLKNERELEAELVYEFTRQGCRSMAYDPIVGSGANACILHYTQNNQPLHEGELVLIDAGGEYENYAADITRTFPVNGRFSKPQKQIYNLVLKAQKAGIACIKPGTPWNAAQNIIVQILTEGLCELGILKGQPEKLIASGAYKAFYMHNSGHWLGLDVHDAGQYKIDGNWRSLQPGMVLTVEPGLYLPRDENIEPHWWNIGVRIEDDILVTESGFENLSSKLPVETDDLEACLRG